MRSHEISEILGVVPDSVVASRLSRESVFLTVSVVVLSTLCAVVCVLSFTSGPSELAIRSATVLGIGGVCLAGLGALLVERHRRLFNARSERVSELNVRLRENAVRKDEFLASVSHELRTPLNVVLGYIDLLLDHSLGPLEPSQRDILHRIANNANNLSRLINDLVDLSRIEAGQMRIEMEAVDLVPLFTDLTAVMDVLLVGNDVTFEVAIDAGCDRLYADPDRLKQIVSNLLVNAVKFTEHGTISLRAEAGTSGRVIIAVTDTGIGIPSADQHAIFEPFRQVHDHEHRAPGAGLGLSISSRLAALMGGTLCVESTPGQGSRFSLVLEGPPANDRSLSTALRKVS